tara:strand:+ start:16013 stop:16324 length:312 start_codon:yes stop_codon:yes gene_type:complete
MPNMKKNMLMMTPAERAAMAKMQMMEGSMIVPPMMAKAGKELKNIPSDNKGLPMLSEEVRNTMGYKMKGGPIGGMPNEEYKKKGEVKAMRYYGGGSTYGRRRS